MGRFNHLTWLGSLQKENFSVNITYIMKFKCNSVMYKKMNKHFNQD